jgi:hypothetical protein
MFLLKILKIKLNQINFRTATWVLNRVVLRVKYQKIIDLHAKKKNKRVYFMENFHLHYNLPNRPLKYFDQFH